MRSREERDEVILDGIITPYDEKIREFGPEVFKNS